MDLNSLYTNHQLLLMRANASTCRDVRDGHLARADAVAGQIAAIQRKSGAAAERAWSGGRVGHHALRALVRCGCAA